MNNKDFTAYCILPTGEHKFFVPRNQDKPQFYLFMVGYGFVKDFDKCNGVIEYTLDPDADGERFDTARQAMVTVKINELDVNKATLFHTTLKSML